MAAENVWNWKDKWVSTLLATKKVNDGKMTENYVSQNELNLKSTCLAYRIN